MKPKKQIVYTYRGPVERGTGKSYAWRDGFSETSADGEIFYPWMTRRECHQDAKAQGGVAVFQEKRSGS